MTSGKGGNKGDIYIGNIWGRKWTIYAAIFIVVVMGVAVCRYIVIQPDQLLIPEDMENVDRPNSEIQ
jgi:hypothetical protein